MTKIIKEAEIKSPHGNELTEAKPFRALFETQIGVIKGEGSTAYLRGEIAQGLFLNYKNIVNTFHPKVPFGIAQIGKAFRNEITQGQFTFRTLEFDLMEFEYFFDIQKQDWEELLKYWKDEWKNFATNLGVREEKLRWRSHEEFELSHYSKRTDDLEYEFPWGFKEMCAVAYRTDFDLKNHMEKTGVDLRQRRKDKSKYIPHVVEPTFGLSRAVTIVLIDAYREEEVKGRKRIYLSLDPKIAPVKAAYFTSSER